MQYRLYLPDFARQKVYYYHTWRKSFIISGDKKFDENLPGSNSYTLEDDTGELRLITITKKPSFLAPKGEITLSSSKNAPESVPAIYPYGRRYTPNELFAMVLSVMVWVPGAVLGLLVAAFVVFKIRPILLSELSFIQKTMRILIYHTGALILYMTIGFVLIYVLKFFPPPV